MEKPPTPELLRALADILPGDRILSREMDRVSFASDAGFYHLLPLAVVRPVDEREVAALFSLSRRLSVPLVFRTGGTSLSGQAVTDGILVDLSPHWKRVTIEDGGGRVRVEPGPTGSMVNARLRGHGRKIGPDPSSISAAMMGGIISNNSSGMCCGVAQNAYHTVRHLRFMLPDGSVYSTEAQADYERFKAEQPLLSRELLAIRERIHGDAALHGRIREKFRMKTTIGYSLNAFIDHAEPLDIFARLLVGAEGTLAFISEAVLETVPDFPCKSTALLYFPDISSACDTIPLLLQTGAAMAELMDRASLRAVQDLPGMPPVVRELPSDAAALLVEFQAADIPGLTQQVDAFLSAAGALPLLHAPSFSGDAAEREFLWKVRKGLFPAVGAVRASGTSVILEDLAFPVDRLGAAVLDLQALFREFRYENAIIFGHAKDGNIHFVVTQSFNTPDEVGRYDRFLRAVVSLVLERHGGTLKAEHGTGRNMAPFVEAEWGGDAYDIITRIKRAADPAGLLNPGVIVNADPEVHIRNLKRMPVVEEEVDRCIECGYCEPVCPSRDITATPRRRIVARRHMALLQERGDREALRRLQREFRHDALDTCAVDGLCGGACPVDINTGDLVKRLRSEGHSPLANRVAALAARRFAVAESLLRSLLRTGAAIDALFGRRATERLTALLRRVLPGFPRWTHRLAALPGPVRRLSPTAVSTEEAPTIVYFPACITRLLGASEGRGHDLMQTFLRVSRKAGIGVVIPEGLSGTCCSQAFSSKGFHGAAETAARAWMDRLWVATREGRLPVVTDVSSCTQTLRQMRPRLDAERRARYDRLTVLDSVEYLHDMVLPRGRHRRLERSVVLHPVCSLEKMGTRGLLVAAARALATEVSVPLSAGCCGMAGDRGFIIPELTASATRQEAVEVCAIPAEGHYSSTRTCEIALSEATGRDYVSILYLADEAMGDGDPPHHN